MNKKILSTLLLLGISLPLGSNSAQALIPIPSKDGSLKFDYGIGDLKEMSNDGEFVANDFIKKTLGYDPSRSWQAGDRPEDVLKVGDLRDYGVGNLSLKEISQKQNIPFDASAIPLNQVGFLQDVSIEDLTDSIDGLENLRVKDVAPLKDILGERFEHYRLENILDRNAGQLNELSRQDSFKEVAAYAHKEVDRYIDNNFQSISQNYTQLKANYTSFSQGNIPGDTTGITNFSSNVDWGQEQLLQLNQTGSEEIKTNISQFLQNNSTATDLEIKQFTNQELAKHQEALNQQLEQVNQNLASQTSQYFDISIGDLDVKDQANLFITGNTFEVENVIRDNLENSLTETGNNISQKATEKIGNLASSDTGFADKVGDIKLSDYDLSDYSVDDIPKLESTDLGEFDQVENSTISDIPNLNSLNLDQFDFTPNFGTGVAKIDLIFSEVEKYANRAISGGFIFNGCHNFNNLNGGCAHVELAGPIFFNEGKQWVTGDSQEVDGGKNLLKSWGGGKEPTGRMPFPEAPFKMVLRNADEVTETVELNLAFNFCVTDITGTRHCTPYNVFEMPVYTFGINDYLYLGII